jgi:hypothetical protein
MDTLLLYDSRGNVVILMSSYLVITSITSLGLLRKQPHQYPRHVRTIP